jgi:phospholipid/cholesterol/gamma-HCH transport system substrate-binding protein
MKITKEAKIGFFAIVCLATFFWGLNFLKGKNIFSKTNTYYAVFNRVDGLKITNEVMLSGYKVGTVKSIRFEEGHTGRLVVALIVGKKYLIPKNSVAKLISADIMGGKAIRLDLVPNLEFHQQGDTLLSSIETGLMDQLIYEMVPMKEKAETLMAGMERVMEGITQVFNDQNKENINHSFASLRNTLDNFDKVSASVDYMLNSNDSELKKTLSNINHVSQKLKDNTEGIDSIIKNFESISDTLARANISQTIARADSALYALNQLMAGLNAGEGSVGALLHNDTLYINLEQSARNLELLLYDMKVNPKRYINFSLFDFSRSKYVEDKK